jgi:rare lipoprotein A (peptidoglycan hydrolase)
MLKNLFVLISLLLLSACALEPTEEDSQTTDNVPAPLMGISTSNTSPALMTSLSAADLKVQSGRASRYKQQDHGMATTSHEIYDMFGLTAAHPTLPIGTYVRVTNNIKQRSVVVRINDRNNDGKMIRLSHRAAKLLNLPVSGGFVKMQPLQPKGK